MSHTLRHPLPTSPVAEALLRAIWNANVWFVDTTLRDGEQAAGMEWTSQARCQTAALLAAIGVRELEVGIPASGEEARQRIRAVAEQVPDVWLLAWCRARMDDLEAASRCPVHGVHLSFPVSERHLRAWGKSPDWVLNTLAQLTTIAAREFGYVTIGAQDASRADVSFLLEFAAAVSESPAIRLRLADTVGILTPRNTETLVATLSSVLGRKLIEFHGHNDLGMATANTLAAWQAGARCLSTTVNGLGERAGNASLTEVAGAIHIACETDVGLDFSNLASLSHFVAAASASPLPKSSPLLGENAFAHSAGIHLTGLQKDPLTYQPCLPALVSRTSTFILTSQSGPNPKLASALSA